MLLIAQYEYFLVLLFFVPYSATFILAVESLNLTLKPWNAIWEHKKSRESVFNRHREQYKSWKVQKEMKQALLHLFCLLINCLLSRRRFIWVWDRGLRVCLRWFLLQAAWLCCCASRCICNLWCRGGTTGNVQDRGELQYCHTICKWGLIEHNWWFKFNWWLKFTAT